MAIIIIEVPLSIDYKRKFWIVRSEIQAEGAISLEKKGWAVSVFM